MPISGGSRSARRCARHWRRKGCRFRLNRWSRNSRCRLRRSADQHPSAVEWKYLAGFEQEAIAEGIAFEREDPALTVCEPILATVEEDEGRALDENALFISAKIARQAGRVGRRVRNGD